MKLFVLIETDGYDSHDVAGVLSDETAALTWVNQKEKFRTYEVHILDKILS